MCKELKRLMLLADCAHLNKTDRDSIQWAIQNLSPEQAETETSFGGWDFQLWPSVPDKRVFEDLIKARKAKNKVIMLQAYIDNAAPHLSELSIAGVTVNEALKIATIGGWTSFKASWILNELTKAAQEAPQQELKTPTDAIKLVNNGSITSIKDIPKPIRMIIETQYRIGNLKPNTMTNLEKIGLTL